MLAERKVKLDGAEEELKRPLYEGGGRKGGFVRSAECAKSQALYA